MNHIYIGIDPDKAVCIYEKGEYKYKEPEDWQALIDCIKWRPTPDNIIHIAYERAYGGNKDYLWLNGNLYGRLAQEMGKQGIEVELITSGSWKSVVRKKLDIPALDMQKKKYIPYIKQHLGDPEMSEHCCDSWGVVQWLLAKEDKE